MKITGEVRGYWVDIRFNNIIHLSYRQLELKGIQTWIEGKDCYDIYLYFYKSEKIHLSYTKREVWEKVIQLIQENR